MNTTRELKVKPQHDKIQGKYFKWIIRKHDTGMWHADGRSNRPNPGRHSLGSKNYDEAIKSLHELDLKRAVDLGLADPAVLVQLEGSILPLQQGYDIYIAHCERPVIMGGIAAKSVQRYQNVFDKAVQFFAEKGLTHWNHVRKEHLKQYIDWLDAEAYAYRTEFFEITAIKTAFNFWIREEYLPPSAYIYLHMKTPQGTSTFCYTDEQIAAIFNRFRAIPELKWLANVIATLAYTGMRISELSSLRWSNVDLAKKIIHLKDESTTIRAKATNAQTTKSGRDRVFPIHDELLPLFGSLQKEKQGRTIFRDPEDGELDYSTMRKTFIEEIIEPLAELFPTPDEEIGFKDGRFHSFRHYFCSKCANRGIPENVVMHWLGHRDSKMVKHYYHLNDDEAQIQMKKFGSLGNHGAE